MSKEYFFSDMPDELKRMHYLEKVFDKQSIKHLENSGLSEHHRCLEIGVGRGSILAFLKTKVKNVIGIDLDCSYVDESLQSSVLQCDFFDFMPDQKFDRIHLRYVLIHNENTHAFLSKCYDLLAPNGKLLIEEPDFTLAKCIESSDIDACERVHHAVCKMFGDANLFADIGSTMQYTLKDSGFVINDIKSYLHLDEGNSDCAKLMALSTKSLQKNYIQTKKCTQEDINTYIQMCETDDSLCSYYATIAIEAQKVEVLDTLVDEAVKMDVSQEVSISYTPAIEFLHSDAQRLNALKLMQSLRKNISAVNFVENLKLAKNYHLISFELGGEIKAIAGFSIDYKLAWGKYVSIDELIVLEEERSQGFAQALIDFIVGYAKECGCEELHIDSDVCDTKTHALFIKNSCEIRAHHLSKKL